MFIPAEITAFRQTVYQVFSECFLHPPALASLPFMADPEWRQSASALLGPEAAKLCKDFTEESGPDRLAVEHAALFVVPGPQQTFPFESNYCEKRLINGENRPGPMLGYVALQVQRAYAECGMPTDLGAGELPDHAGVELRFMSLLAAAERLSAVSEDPQVREGIRQLEAGFLNKHILQWFPQWLKCLHMRAKEPFYKSGALVLKGFLRTEKITLDQTTSSR